MTERPSLPGRPVRVLLLAEPKRPDGFAYLGDREGGEPALRFELLWHESPEDYAGPLPPFIERVYHWSDYPTPDALLDAVRPDRIVFMEIIDLRQIALVAAARARRIPTFYLEHGAAGDVATARSRLYEIPVRARLGVMARRGRRLKQALAVRRFYLASLRYMTTLESRLAFLAIPFGVIAMPSLRVLTRLQFRERVPESAICFSRVNAEEFAFHHGVAEHYRLLLPGVPMFDRYFRFEAASEARTLLYIDSPFLDSGQLGWTASHEESIARALERFAIERNVRVTVKLHPRTNAERWHGYGLDPRVRILQQGDHHETFLKAELILSFASSLLTGLVCARKNIVYLRWHPAPARYGADLDQTGLSHGSEHPDELFSRYDDWRAHNLCEENGAAYQAFVERYNQPFDGQAGRRVRALIRALPEGIEPVQGS